MKTLQNKGFTLVELIVVITILAILGTIAFISLQGYSTDAKNSKVTSDLKNIASALEAKRTQSSDVLSSFMGTAKPANAVTGDVTTIPNTGTGVATTLAPANYEVGNMDFTKLGQNGTDFKDANGANADYLFAYVTVTGHSGYQLVGQIVENDAKQARVIGNYFESDAGDVDGLVSKSPVGTTAGLTNDAAITAGTTITDLYLGD